jgi:hypothetical protein
VDFSRGLRGFTRIVLQGTNQDEIRVHRRNPRLRDTAKSAFIRKIRGSEERRIPRSSAKSAARKNRPIRVHRRNPRLGRTGQSAFIGEIRGPEEPANPRSSAKSAAQKNRQPAFIRKIRGSEKPATRVHPQNPRLTT